MKLLAIIILSLSVFGQAITPTLTEVEQLRRINILLRQQNINNLQRELNRDIDDYNKAITKTYPGFQLNAEGNLIKIPEEKKPDSE